MLILLEHSHFFRSFCDRMLFFTHFLDSIETVHLNCYHCLNPCKAVNLYFKTDDGGDTMMIFPEPLISVLQGV